MNFFIKIFVKTIKRVSILYALGLLFVCSAVNAKSTCESLLNNSSYLTELNLGVDKLDELNLVILRAREILEPEFGTLSSVEILTILEAHFLEKGREEGLKDRIRILQKEFNHDMIHAILSNDIAGKKYRASQLKKDGIGYYILVRAKDITSTGPGTVKIETTQGSRMTRRYIDLSDIDLDR